MGQVLKLRKCEEHESCQLQSVDGGDWQHTPADTHIASRFSKLSDAQRETLERITQEMERAQNTRAWAEESALRVISLEERCARLEARLAGLQGETQLKLLVLQEAENSLEYRARTLDTLAAKIAQRLGDADNLRAQAEAHKSEWESRVAYIEELDRKIEVLGKGLLTESNARDTLGEKLRRAIAYHEGKGH